MVWGPARLDWLCCRLSRKTCGCRWGGTPVPAPGLRDCGLALNVQDQLGQQRRRQHGLQPSELAPTALHLPPWSSAASGAGSARAKEKKARLNLQQITGKDAEPAETAEECKFCSRQYQNKFGIQEHIFDREHLDNVRKAIEGGNYEPETPGYSLNQKASALYKANNGGEQIGEQGQGKEEGSDELPPPPPPPAPLEQQQPGYSRGGGSRPGGQYEAGEGQVQPYRPDQQPTSFPEFAQQQTPQGSAYPGYPRQQQGYDQYYSGMATYHPQHHYPPGETGYPSNYHSGYEQGHPPPPPHAFPGSRHYPHMYPAGNKILPIQT